MAINDHLFLHRLSKGCERDRSHLVRVPAELIAVYEYVNKTKIVHFVTSFRNIP